MSTIKLIAGLGNPGPKHEQDRHNAGFWFVDALAAAHGASFANESKFHGELCQASIASRGVRLLKPSTYMNRSGQSVRAVTDYYRIDPEEVLVVHDELDLPPGTARLKRGGGHGGHNGLRDLISHIGRDFLRLRIGIGHPGDRNRVVGFVLQAPGRQEAVAIDDAIRASVDALSVLLRDGEQKAMHQLHSRASAPAEQQEQQ
jgi:PTH1 family peptidyl-tRNA hydrolase